MSIPDRKKVGSSKHVPYIHGEHHSERHSRRLVANLNEAVVVGEWSKKNGISFKIKNHGHHWIFTKGRWLAEWWPSSAKLVINRRYGNGTHVHDWEQAMKHMERELGRWEEKKALKIQVKP